MINWYENPAWFSLTISVIAVLVAFLAFLNSRRTSRLTITNKLIEQQIGINEAFLKFKLKGPYATLLKIPETNIELFQTKAVLLLLHINLLRNVFSNKDILEKRIITFYSDWAQKILTPWIMADEDLKVSFNLLCDSEDLVGTEFIYWLKKIFPKVQ